MKKVPEVLLVVDGVYEKQAVKEGRGLKIDTFAILNTNGDDTILTNAIPANTNSVKSIDFLANELKQALSNVKIVAKTPVKRINTSAPAAAKKEVVEAKAETKAPTAAKKEEVKETTPKAEKKAPAKKAPAKKTAAKKEETTEEK